ncbi:efflux RND transporter permease subunit, partial [Pseudomonas aeruginosa]
GYSFTQPIEMRVSEMIIGVRGDLAVKIYGPDLGTLSQLGGKIESLLKTVQGNQDVYTVQNDGVQYLRVEIDRLQAGRFGLSVEAIQDALRVQIEGQQAGLVIEGNQRTPILIRSDES